MNLFANPSGGREYKLEGLRARDGEKRNPAF